MTVVDDPTPAYQDLRHLTEPTVVDDRSYAGFNPARRDDVRLFRAVLDGMVTTLRGASVTPTSANHSSEGRRSGASDGGPVPPWGAC